eukprot:CAMPEP_0196797436 /NCGR_PEP_ID=MMETSP1104-20130614/38638_1 /TAXON_ID=33652 /ORGANISM="Cafeteria sp., Strain Caron Lab Isolate" /LENGTH=1061 /DNA_ID=CAMNT_0042167843 /DNA_START=196 /DNA_END=3377 /DNA_ORIENTATION=+
MQTAQSASRADSAPKPGRSRLVEDGTGAEAAALVVTDSPLSHGDGHASTGAGSSPSTGRMEAERPPRIVAPRSQASPATQQDAADEEELPNLPTLPSIDRSAVLAHAAGTVEAPAGVADSSGESSTSKRGGRMRRTRTASAARRRRFSNGRESSTRSGRSRGRSGGGDGIGHFVSKSTEAFDSRQLLDENPRHWLSLRFKDKGVERQFSAHYDRFVVGKVRYRTRLWLTLHPLLGLVLISSTLWDHFVETTRPAEVEADQGLSDPPEPLIRLHVLPGWTLALFSVMFVHWLSNLDGFRFILQRAVTAGFIAQSAGHLWMLAVVLHFGSFAPEEFRIGLPLPLLVAHSAVFPVVVYAFHFSGLRFASALKVATFTLVVELVVILVIGWDCAADHVPTFVVELVASVALALSARTNEERVQKEFLIRAAIGDDKRRADDVLMRMLPKPIIRQLNEGISAHHLRAQSYDEVTVMFSRIADWEEIVFSMSPRQLLDFLHHMYTAIDELVDKFPRVEKIESAGDTHISVTGCPEPDEDHAANLALFACALRALSHADRRFVLPSGQRVRLQIGLHSGPAVGGVVGTRTFQYKLFGDTVNTASRMCSTGQPNRIQTSRETQMLVLASQSHRFGFRGDHIKDVKGKGPMACMFLHYRGRLTDPEAQAPAWQLARPPGAAGAIASIFSVGSVMRAATSFRFLGNRSRQRRQPRKSRPKIPAGNRFLALVGHARLLLPGGRRQERTTRSKFRERVLVASRSMRWGPAAAAAAAAAEKEDEGEGAEAAKSGEAVTAAVGGKGATPQMSPSNAGASASPSFEGGLGSMMFGPGAAGAGGGLEAAARGKLDALLHRVVSASTSQQEQNDEAEEGEGEGRAGAGAGAGAGEEELGSSSRSVAAVVAGTAGSPTPPPGRGRRSSRRGGGGSRGRRPSASSGAYPGASESSSLSSQTRWLSQSGTRTPVGRHQSPPSAASAAKGSPHRSGGAAGGGAGRGVALAKPTPSPLRRLFTRRLEAHKGDALASSSTGGETDATPSFSAAVSRAAAAAAGGGQYTESDRRGRGGGGGGGGG